MSGFRTNPLTWENEPLPTPRARRAAPKASSKADAAGPEPTFATIPADALQDPEKLVALGYKLPLTVMLELINDPRVKKADRARIAAAAAPYLHARKDPEAVGKKEKDATAAKEAAVGKFLPPMAPGGRAERDQALN